MSWAWGNYPNPHYQPTGHTGMDFIPPVPWRLNDSGFIVWSAQAPELEEDTPIFTAMVLENNGMLFSQLRRRSWE